MLPKSGPLDPILVTEDGYYRPPPSLPSIDNPPPSAQSTTGPNENELRSLSHEQLVQRLMSTESRLIEWNTAASHLVTALALSPDMTEAYYARSLRSLLASAISSLEYVDHVRHVECSMPCVHNETPVVSLLKWSSLDYSEWFLKWSPTSWWVSVSIDGSKWGIAFNCLTKVSDIRLKGTVRCTFSTDLTGMRISFVKKPLLSMNIESSVGWGAVPLPVREQMEVMVRDEIENFVVNRLTGENDMVVVLRRKALAKLSELDIQEATLQARRSSSINLRSPHLL